MGFSRVLALCGAAAVAYGYDPIAYYTPLSNVSSELGYDSFLADLGTAMGSGESSFRASQMHSSDVSVFLS